MYPLVTITLILTLTLAIGQGQEDMGNSSVICPKGCVDDEASTEFYCVDSECTEFPFNEIHSVETVTHIDVSFNDITTVPTMSFPLLIFLDLSNNLIHNISTNAFENCPALLTLNLSNNQLTSVEQKMFSIMKTLETLHLDHNQIMSIQDNTFFHLNSLIQLNLSYNKLSELDKNSLTDLDELEILHLEANKFSRLHYNYFQGMKKLQYLSLRNNIIESIEEDTFAHLDGLLRLDLGRNKITGIKSSIFHTGARHPFSSLQAIHLDNNEIHELFNRTFSPLTKLQYIFLDNNPLLLVGPDHQFPASLKLLSMRDNTKLLSLKNGTFTGLRNLTDVILSGSHHLREIQAGAFDGGRSRVKTLDVSYCALLTLDPGLLNWTVVTRLDLSGNPWNCDCHLKWMKDELSENITRNAVCTYPHQIKGQSLANLEVDAMSCTFLSVYRHRMGVGLIVATTILFVFVTTYLIYTYRKRIFEPCRGGGRRHYTTLFNKEDTEQAEGAVSIQWDKDASETEPLNNAAPAFV